MGNVSRGGSFDDGFTVVGSLHVLWAGMLLLNAIVGAWKGLRDDLCFRVRK